MNDQLLQIDLRLMLLRYGRQRVLHALARLGDQSLDELERQLETAEQKRRIKRAEPSVMELVAAEGRERPDIAEPLRTLAVRFENRMFLPQLRDVQRFLDRMRSSQGKLKSRAAAAPALIRALAKLTKDDLLRLAAEDKPPGESDYDLLARAIMGPVKRG